jgi:hypothetical protein
MLLTHPATVRPDMERGFFTYRLDDRQVQRELTSSEIEEVFVGKLYFFDRGRNAWHSTWSKQYFNEGAFNPDVKVVKARVESSRSQGSQWRIHELPVLALRSRDVTALVANPYSRYPLTSYQRVEFHLHLLAQLKAFRPQDDYLWRFLAVDQEIEPARRPFRVFDSVSSGGTYYLGWRRTRLGYHVPNSRMVTGLGRKLAHAIGCTFRENSKREKRPTI